MKRFLWITAFLLLAGIAVLGWSLSPEMLIHWVQRDVAIAINGRTITQNDLQQALRDDLWRRGQTWEQMDAAAQAEARQQVLQKLVDEQLVRHYREKSSPLPPADEAAVQTELTLWRKQFQQESEGAQRLAYQQLTEASLEAKIRASQLDRIWLERQIASTVSVDDVRTWYAERRMTLQVPVAYRAAHIYLTRHDKSKPEDRLPEIQEIHQRLVTGKATFAELAAQFSDDDRTKLRGGDLHWFTAERMPADFIKGVAALKVGETSTPIATALGWHIVQLTAKKPATIPPLEAVSAEIEAALRSQKRQAAIDAVLQNLRQRAEVEGLLNRRADAIAGATPSD